MPNKDKSYKKPGDKMKAPKKKPAKKPIKRKAKPIRKKKKK